MDTEKWENLFSVFSVSLCEIVVLENEKALAHAPRPRGLKRVAGLPRSTGCPNPSLGEKGQQARAYGNGQRYSSLPPGLLSAIQPTQPLL